MEHKGGVILLDIPEGAPDFDRRFLEQLGHPVIVCHGPHEGELCPILRAGGECPLVEGAHGIVFSLDLERPQHRAILSRYQTVVRPDLPLRVVVKPGQETKYAELLRGVEVWCHEPTAGELDGFAARVEAIEE